MGLLQWLKGAAGSQKVTDVSAADPLPMGLQSAAIVAPTDIQAILRTQSFLTTTNLAAVATYTSPTIDGIQAKRLTGSAYMDTSYEIAYQHSHDGTTWYTRNTVAVAAGVSHFYDEMCYDRYVRITLKNTGAVASTTLKGSGYLSVQ